MTRGWRFSFLLVIQLAGCSSGQSSINQQVISVEGKVLVDGVPANYAKVKFTPIDDSDGVNVAIGTVDENGMFALTTSKVVNGKLTQFPGAFAGDYLVSISWRIPKFPQLREKERGYGPELIPKKYLNPSKSGPKELIIKITDETEKLKPFLLTSN